MSLCLILLLPMLLACPRPLSATGDASTRKLNQRMVLLLRQKSYRPAMQVALTLHRTTGEQRFLTVICLCMDELRDDPDALRCYRMLAQEVTNPQKRRVIDQRIAVVTRRLPLTHRRVEIISVPAGARIAIDGKPVATPTPLSVWLKLGQHRLTLTLPRHRPLERVLQVGPGPEMQLRLRLELGPRLRLTRKPTRPAKLLLTGVPKGAQIRIDDELYTRAPESPLVLKPGNHRVVISAIGYRRYDAFVWLEPGSTRRLHIAMPRIPQIRETSRSRLRARLRLAAFSLLGAGATLAAAGMGLHLQGWSVAVSANKRVKNATQEQLHSTAFQEAYYADRRRAKRYYLAAYVMYGVSGAALITGGLLLLFEPSSESKTRLTVSPALGPGLAGVDLRFTF